MQESNSQLLSKVLKSGFSGQLTLEELANKKLIIIMSHNDPINYEKKLKNKKLDFKEFSYQNTLSQDWQDENEKNQWDVFREYVTQKGESDNNSRAEMEFLFDTIEHVLNKSLEENNENNSLFDIIEKYGELFDREKRKLKDENLIGLMGEYLTIIELQNNGINAINWFHTDEYMKYDLYASDYKKYIEIKTSLALNNIIKIKQHQISDNEDYTILINVTLQKDDLGKNIVDVLEILKNSSIMNYDFLEYINDRVNQFKKFPNILNKRFNINQTRFTLFKCEDLPKLQWDNNERIRNISYDIDCVGIKKYDIKEILCLLNS